MMTYSGSQWMEHLCQMNEWSSSSIPLHALEVGLQQRQLDTVSLFLHNKESCEWMPNVHFGSIHSLFYSLSCFA